MTAATLAKSAWKVIPMFDSRSISDTVDFYIKTLGFELGSVKSKNQDTDDLASVTEEEKRQWFFCSVFIGEKADANFYFSKVAANEFKASQAMIALGTSELDEYYKYIKNLGSGVVEIAEDIEDTPWGFRQFTVKDNDGNQLTFFKFLEGGNPGEE
ncbi:glyoxalase family protein [Talaromyces proteolyticus]|uniref:Glyoxalase family protein n=1 Tax=Talaromyces proteolyticus TaxID=1131652 RepID=A0AAD4PTJ7_9EURO|nr:glyoxalase family protein [Talaromyces proteolyticus]KAH8690891.1 glyoxalase family protein [Talaromyces proteolyticus]